MCQTVPNPVSSALLLPATRVSRCFQKPAPPAPDTVSFFVQPRQLNSPYLLLLRYTQPIAVTLLAQSVGWFCRHRQNTESRPKHLPPHQTPIHCPAPPRPRGGQAQTIPDHLPLFEKVPPMLLTSPPLPRRLTPTHNFPIHF